LKNRQGIISELLEMAGKDYKAKQKVLEANKRIYEKQQIYKTVRKH
jgi:hypothetical protein